MSELLEIVRELVEAAGMKQAFETAEMFHLRLDQEALEPLVIESWPASPVFLAESRHITVAHYFQEHGDAIADPEILMTDSGIPILIQQREVYQQVFTALEAAQTLVDKKALQSVLSFMATWARNIREQGWLTVAARM